MNGRLLTGLLCLALLAGCAERPSADAAAPPEEDGLAAGEGAAENLFETMPHEFMFCSGAGGWSTTLTVAEDGAFTGLYQDSDMGVADPEKCPNGTQYLCAFSGAFTQPEKVSDHVYTMELKMLEHPADGTEEYADGIRYIYSGPYGLEAAGELLVYLPDTPVEELPEMVIQAARGPYDWKATPEGTLGLYVLYNVNEELGFVEYPRVTGED